jgi:exopolysaccharide production protein ExoZ
VQAIKYRLSTMFELQASNRNAAMEGLRAFAVILVFFVHYHSCFMSWVRPGVPTADFAYALRSVGYIGVDLFFVLSGYLIYGAVLPASFSYRKFISRRVQRIYPTFLVLLVVYIGLSFLVPGESKLPGAPMDAALYIVANALLLPGMLNIEPIISVAWTLSYEFFFYLVLPVLVAALGIRRRKAGPRAVIFTALALVICALPCLALGHVQLLLFVSGMFVYEARARMQAVQESGSGRWIRAAETALAVLVLPIAYGVLWMASAWTEPVAYLVRAVWLFFALGFVVSVALTQKGAVGKVCSLTPLRWLGNISYSYYLLHGLVLKVISTVLLRMTGPDTASSVLFWLVMPLAFGATVVGSAVLFLAIEKPLSLSTEPIPFPWRAMLSAAPGLHLAAAPFALSLPQLALSLSGPTTSPSPSGVRLLRALEAPGA